MWYLERYVNPNEWAKLANLPGCTPQRDDKGDGTYVFAPSMAPEVLVPRLREAAPGYWRQVA